MPYGAKRSQKGRARKFTSAEELEAQRGEDGSWRKKKEESSEESSSEEEDGNDKDAPIEVHNPNRVAQKTKKVSELDDISKVKPADLSRREKEEIAKAESQRRYQQLHAQGKTDEARADLARLAIIRKQREEAAEKRKQEKLEEEERKKASKEASLNAIKSKGGSGGRRKR